MLLDTCRSASGIFLNARLVGAKTVKGPERYKYRHRFRYWLSSSYDNCNNVCVDYGGFVDDNDVDVYQERQVLLQDQQLSQQHTGWSAGERFVKLMLWDDDDDNDSNDKDAFIATFIVISWKKMQFACADHYDGYEMMMTVTNYDVNYKQIWWWYYHVKLA